MGGGSPFSAASGSRKCTDEDARWAPGSFGPLDPVAGVSDGWTRDGSGGDSPAAVFGTGAASRAPPTLGNHVIRGETVKNAPRPPSTVELEEEVDMVVVELDDNENVRRKTYSDSGRCRGREYSENIVVGVGGGNIVYSGEEYKYSRGEND